jgi:hypothetical protein
MAQAQAQAQAQAHAKACRHAATTDLALFGPVSDHVETGSDKLPVQNQTRERQHWTAGFMRQNCLQTTIDKSGTTAHDPRHAVLGVCAPTIDFGRKRWLELN